MVDILPDCRLTKAPAGINWGIAGTWVPIFCANCGANGGLVPSENMTFVFYLCNTCAETHGAIAGMMLMPDEVFFAQVAEAQLELFGYYPTEDELAKLDESSSLIKLMRSRGV